MFFCVLGLTYTAFTRDDSDWHNNILTGLVGVFVLFMIISILTLPNGPFTRPHPALWRCVLGVSILYLLLVQFLLHQVGNLPFNIVDMTSFFNDCACAKHIFYFYVNHIRDSDSKNISLNDFDFYLRIMTRYEPSSSGLIQR